MGGGEFLITPTGRQNNHTGVHVGTWGQANMHACKHKQLQMMSCDQVQKEKELGPAEAQVSASSLHSWSQCCQGGGSRVGMVEEGKLLFLLDWAYSVASHLGVLYYARVTQGTLVVFLLL